MTRTAAAQAIVACTLLATTPAFAGGGTQDCNQPCVPATSEVPEVQTSGTNSTDIGALRGQLVSVERKLNETRVYLGKLDRYSGQQFHDIVEQFEELTALRTALVARIAALEAKTDELGDSVAENKVAIHALNERVDASHSVAGWTAGLGASFGEPINGVTGPVQTSLQAGLVWGWEGAKVGHLFIPSLSAGQNHVGASFDAVTYWSSAAEKDLGFFVGVIADHSGLGKGWSYTGASVGGHGGLWYSMPVGNDLELTLKPGVFAGLQGTRHQALPATRLEVTANLAWLWNSHADRE